MASHYSFKHGVGVNTAFGVCIRDDAEFWSFAPEHALAVLKEARVMFAHAQDVEHIERFEMNDCGRMLVGVLEETPHVVRAMQRVDQNPLADDSHKDYSRKVLEYVRVDRAKKGLRRAPRLSLRQKVIERDKGKCRYCGRIVGDDFHLDHIVPYSLGGKKIRAVGLF